MARNAWHWYDHDGNETQRWHRVSSAMNMAEIRTACGSALTITFLAQGAYVACERGYCREIRIPHEVPSLLES